MNNDLIKQASLFLRFGLGWTFIYAAISQYLNPQNWIGFYPDFLLPLAQQDWFVILRSSGEALFGLLIILGVYPFYLATAAMLALFGIVIFNLGQMDIVFRDIGLFFAALALAALNSSRKE